MRRTVLLMCALGAAAFAAKNPQLETVHTVYMLPMSSSLDQYLATCLTRGGPFQVVTDPQKADAIFTDRIGQAFEDRLSELYPAAKKEPADEEQSKDLKEQKFQRFGTFAKGRGTVFLVDRQSRAVVWSIYSPVHSFRPDDVNRRAEQITIRLRKDATAKAK